MRTAHFSGRLWRGSACLPRGGFPRGVCPGGGCLGMSATPPNGQTDACENITLPQTSFAGGKYKISICEMHCWKCFMSFKSFQLNVTASHLDAVGFHGDRSRCLLGSYDVCCSNIWYCCLDELVTQTTNSWYKKADRIDCRTMIRVRIWD